MGSGPLDQKPVIITKIKTANVVPDTIKFTKRSGARYNTTTGPVGVELGPKASWSSSRDGLPGACPVFLKVGAARGGVEPPTFRFSVGRSYQLSYLALVRKEG